MSRVLLSLALALTVACTAVAQSANQAENRAVAIFAGGCFWCTEADFEKVPGVISTTSGYTGGRVANPSYTQVSAGGTGHAEAVEVVYDPHKVSYDELLSYYWRHVDPTVRTGSSVTSANNIAPRSLFTTTSSANVRRPPK